VLTVDRCGSKTFRVVEHVSSSRFRE